MITISAKINKAIEVAKLNNINVLGISTGWSQVKQVAHMSLPANEELLNTIAALPGLRRWVSSPTPHNMSEIGFTDDEALVAIVFPS